MLATNLHADDIDEAREQVCGTNGVQAPHFNKFELLVLLRIKGGYSGARRWVDLVYSSDGSSEHELTYTASGELNKDSGKVDPEYVAACRDFLCESAAKTRTIEQTRERVIEFLGSSSSEQNSGNP